MKAEILQLGLNQIQFKNKIKGGGKKKERKRKQANRPTVSLQKDDKDEQRRKEGVRGGGLLHRLAGRREGGTGCGNTF